MRDRAKWLAPAIAGSVGILIAWSALVSAPAQAQSGPGRRVALVIGIGDYGTLGNLPNPPNDARLIKAALEQDGFDVELVVDADLMKLKGAVRHFGDRLAQAGPGATALFYYAGHGIQSKGINWLIPSRANIARDADLDLEAVKVDSVLEQMVDTGAATNIVVLDACRNAPFARGFRGGTQGLAQMEAPDGTGTFIAYSTAPGRVAVDGTGADSPFARALAQELGQPGESIDDVFTEVRSNVKQMTGGLQTPWTASSLTTRFYFRGAAAVAVREVPAVAAGVPTERGPLESGASRAPSNAEPVARPSDDAVANQPGDSAPPAQAADNAPAQGEVISDEATYQRKLAEWQAKIEESRQANEEYERKKAEVARQEAESVEKAKQDRADWERRVAACKAGDYSQCATQAAPQ